MIICVVRLAEQGSEPWLTTIPGSAPSGRLHRSPRRYGMDTYCARRRISDHSRVAAVWRAKVRRPAEHNCPAQRAPEGCAERALGPRAAPSETSVSARGSSWQKSKLSRRGRSAAMTATRATTACAITPKKREHEDGSWVPGGRGQGREGQSKGYGRSGGNGTGPSGLQSKKRRSDNEGS